MLRASLKAETPLPSGVQTPVVDEERMRPGHWLGSVLSLPFSALTRMGDKKDTQPGKACATYLYSYLEQVGGLSSTIPKAHYSEGSLALTLLTLKLTLTFGIVDLQNNGPVPTQVHLENDRKMVMLQNIQKLY